MGRRSSFTTGQLMTSLLVLIVIILTLLSEPEWTIIILPKFYLSDGRLSSLMQSKSLTSKSCWLFYYLGLCWSWDMYCWLLSFVNCYKISYLTCLLYKVIQETNLDLAQGQQSEKFQLIFKIWNFDRLTQCH